MKITAVKLYTMHIPLITPFKTALRTVDAIDDLIVVLETDDGQRGFGEAPPTAVITGDTIPSVAGGITQFIAPKLIGREVESSTNCTISSTRRWFTTPRPKPLSKWPSTTWWASVGTCRFTSCSAAQSASWKPISRFRSTMWTP